MIVYSQHFIFFITLELVQKASVLHCTWLEKFARDKHSSLLGPLIYYKENKVSWIVPQYHKSVQKWVKTFLEQKQTLLMKTKFTSQMLICCNILYKNGHRDKILVWFKDTYFVRMNCCRRRLICSDKNSNLIIFWRQKCFFFSRQKNFPPKIFPTKKVSFFRAKNVSRRKCLFFRAKNITRQLLNFFWHSWSWKVFWVLS